MFLTVRIIYLWLFFYKYIMNFLSKIVALGVFLYQINGRNVNSVLTVLGKER